MLSEMIVLMSNAAGIGFVHTLLGPDHYLPFIAMSKARGLSMFKTGLVTVICGVGHILSSVVLGFIGITLGIAVFKLEAIESVRGDLAAWFLIVFGFTYFIWGLHRAIRKIPHQHLHLHQGGQTHYHPHSHINEHTHVHSIPGRRDVTAWALFTIFVFGPCEPLIPLLMYPAAKGNLVHVIAVAAIFGIVTIATMLGIVLVTSYGLSSLPACRIKKYSHALAGLIILLCGGAIKFLGL